jgi:small-conductance mechanosensitive channel
MKLFGGKKWQFYMGRSKNNSRLQRFCNSFGRITVSVSSVIVGTLVLLVTLFIARWASILIERQRTLRQHRGGARSVSPTAGASHPS